MLRPLAILAAMAMMLVACGDSSAPAENLLEARMASEAADVAYLVAELEGRADLPELKREAEVLRAEYEYMVSAADADTLALAEMRYIRVFPWGDYAENTEEFIYAMETLVIDADSARVEAELQLETTLEELARTRAEHETGQRQVASLQAALRNKSEEAAELKRELAQREALLEDMMVMKPEAALCLLDPGEIYSPKVRDIIEEMCS